MTQTAGIDRREYDQLERRLGQVEAQTQTIAGLVNSIMQAQTLFEYKHDQAKRVSEKLESLVEKINERGDNHLQRVEDMMDDRESRLNSSIVQHKEIIMLEIQNRTATISTFNERIKEAETAIASLNKIIWLAMGGAAVISFVVEKLFSIISG